MDVQQYKDAVENEYGHKLKLQSLTEDKKALQEALTRKDQELLKMMLEKKYLQETLERREKETESMLMEIITVQNQSKILGEQLLKMILETSKNFSEGNMTLKSIEVTTLNLYQLLTGLDAASQIAFSQINQTKSDGDKYYSFGEFNFRISS